MCERDWCGRHVQPADITTNTSTRGPAHHSCQQGGSALKQRARKGWWKSGAFLVMFSNFVFLKNASVCLFHVSYFFNFIWCCLFLLLSFWFGQQVPCVIVRVGCCSRRAHTQRGGSCLPLALDLQQSLYEWGQRHSWSPVRSQQAWRELARNVEFREKVRKAWGRSSFFFFQNHVTVTSVIKKSNTQF